MEMPLRKVFYRDETFSLEYEEMGEEALIHMYVYSFTHNTVKKWYYETERLKDHLVANGFVTAFTVTPNPRFVKLFNGKHQSGITYDGQKYEVVTWDLKPQR